MFLPSGTKKKGDRPMALFGEKKSPVDKLWEAFDKLPDEDKASFRAKLEDIDKAEDEREIDKIEEEKAEEPEKADEKKEEVREESEEIGKEVDEAEEEKAEVDEEPKEAEAEVKEPIADEVVEEDKAEEPMEKVAEEEKEHDLFAGFEARLKALEDKFLSLSEAEEPKDIGVSGFGKQTKEDVYEDKRAEDIVRRLGGRAY